MLQFYDVWLSYPYSYFLLHKSSSSKKLYSYFTKFLWRMFIFFLITDLQNNSKVLAKYSKFCFHALHNVLMLRKLPASHRFLNMQEASALITTPKLSPWGGLSFKKKLLSGLRPRQTVKVCFKSEYSWKCCLQNTEWQNYSPLAKEIKFYKNKSPQH